MKQRSQPIVIWNLSTGREKGNRLSMAQSLFYIFGSLAVFSANMVIFSKNPVRAVLFLVMTFFSTAALWMLLEAEFLSIILVLVYVGAVLVLFLFVVMMLDVELTSLQAGFIRFLPLGLCIALLLIAGLIYAVDSNRFSVVLPMSNNKINNAVLLGTLLYTRFLYPFELAGVLLLVAIIAAISLTCRKRKESKAPEPAKQVKLRKEDRLQLIKMESGRT